MRPFLVRLRLAATKPWVLWISVGAITAASVWTYVRSTFLLSPVLQPMGDFDAYYRAATDLNANLDPYLRYNHDIPFSLSVGYIYPPFLARLLQPVAHLSLEQAHIVALVFLQLSVLTSVLLTWRMLDLRSRAGRLLVLDAFLLSSGLVANVEVGNLNVVLMALTLAWVLAYGRGASPGWGFVGLNAGLKLQQLPLFGLALLRRDWWGLIFGAAALLVTLVIGGLALGYEFFIRVLPRLTNTVPTGAQNTSLLADIERLLHPGSDNLTYDPTYPESQLFLVPILGAVLIVTVIALRGLTDRHLEALIALAAVPLLSNYLGAPHLLLLLPVGILLIERALHLRAHVAFVVLAICLVLLADYPLFYTLVTPINYFFARAVFYELGPGLAALCIWLVSLRLAACSKFARRAALPAR